MLTSLLFIFMQFHATAFQDETLIAALTGSMVLVFTTESDQIDALETIARSFVEGLANQGI